MARQAYIVNTDSAGKPGQHWLALWTEGQKRQVFDSYGLPLSIYDQPELQDWWSKWPELEVSDRTLQAMDSQTCGHYALMFLKSRAAGHTFRDL